MLQQRLPIRCSRAKCRRAQQGCPFHPRPTHQPFGSDSPVSRRPGRRKRRELRLFGPVGPCGWHRSGRTQGLQVCVPDALIVSAELLTGLRPPPGQSWSSPRGVGNETAFTNKNDCFCSAPQFPHPRQPRRPCYSAPVPGNSQIPSEPTSSSTVLRPRRRLSENRDYMLSPRQSPICA